MADNGRTHEPNLRELTAQLDDLRLFLDERDRRYEERFKAMDDKTTLALAASEKAVTKAEVATEKRFDSVNEMRGSLNDMTSTLLTKAEASAKFTALDSKQEEMKKDIISLRESRSAGSGKEYAHEANTQQKQFDIRTLISIFAALFAFAAIMVSVVEAILKK